MDPREESPVVFFRILRIVLVGYSARHRKAIGWRRSCRWHAADAGSNRNERAVRSVTLPVCHPHWQANVTPRDTTVDRDASERAQNPEFKGVATFSISHLSLTCR